MERPQRRSGLIPRGRVIRIVLAATSMLCVAVFVGCTPPDPSNTTQQQKYTRGALLSTQQEFDAVPKAITFGAAAGDLPASVDLTTTDRIPPIGDQAYCGACVGFSTGYCMSTYLTATQRKWTVTRRDRQASPAWLLEKCGEVDADSLCCQGAYFQTALDILVKQGCASWSKVPFGNDQAAGVSCPTNSSTYDAATFRIGSYHGINPANRDAIKAELANKRVVTFGAYCYTDFQFAAGSGVYTGNGVKETMGHAMALVGYDDNKGAYRVMNSWGTGWGDSGFLWVAYDAFEDMAVEAYTAEPMGTPPPDPEPDPNEPADPDPDPTPGNGPNAYLGQAFQWAQYDYWFGVYTVYLIFEYMFDEAVFIRTVAVTDPYGGVGSQNYNMWYAAGYVYFWRTDGYQWVSGDYQLRFDVTTQAGQDITYTGTATVAPLGWWSSKGKPIEFLGKVLVPPDGAAKLPARGVAEGVLGANHNPATVTLPPPDKP